MAIYEESENSQPDKKKITRRAIIGTKGCEIYEFSIHENNKNELAVKPGTIKCHARTLNSDSKMELSYGVSDLPSNGTLVLAVNQSKDAKTSVCNFRR